MFLEIFKTNKMDTIVPKMISLCFFEYHLRPLMDCFLHQGVYVTACNLTFRQITKS